MSYGHDATGNLIKRGNDTFAYDGYVQLVSTTVGGKSAVYRYNVSGQRVTKTVDGETTAYLYDTDGQLLAEAVSGVVTREYLWLGAKPVAYVTGGQVYYIHTDHQDTPQVLTDGTGQPVWTVQSYPFGKQVPTGGITFNLRYPGQYYDAETGLHYNWHRYYDPNIAWSCAYP